jgi:hypothetical protein
LHHHSPGTEPKIELPGADLGRVVPVFIAECDAQLDQLEQIDITSKRLIVVVRRAFEGSDWSRYYSRKLSVLLIDQRRDRYAK